ncbi:OmpA family protein [Rhodobacter sp. CZR27]|uniref:OmpA family protein n=1 Tax=Rhodobacter sp. CZR27 TaxID=2033869 RepID=UPI000BBE9F4D|nr:OmpA family protein [Rhodobacter sp. CZR27]
MILKTRAVTVVAAALLLAGCAEPYGSGKAGGDGAVVGGLTGGAAGQAIGDERSPSVLGSIIGAASGILGSSLDDQARELRAALGSEASVVNTGRELVVTLPESVTFDVGSAVLRPDFRPAVVSLSRSLQDHPGTIAIVTGHTDTAGSAEANQQLSEERAAAVGRILVETGTPAQRIRTFGRGSGEPVASNEAASGRAANRRVVVTIRPES